MGVEIILKIAGVGLLTAIVCIILKKSDRDDMATFATLAGLIVVIVLVMDIAFENLMSGIYRFLGNLGH